MPDAQNSIDSPHRLSRRIISGIGFYCRRKALFICFVGMILAFGLILWRSAATQWLEDAVSSAGGEFRDPNSLRGRSLLHVGLVLQNRILSPSVKGPDASFQLFGPARDSAWILDYRGELRSLPGIRLSLNNYSHTEKLLKTLEGSNNIHSVMLLQTQITDEMLRSLATQKNLTFLALNDCEQFKGKLRLLEPLKQLDRLELLRTPIDQGDLDTLQHFSTLTEFAIDSSVITPQNIEALSACTRLQKLVILGSTDQTVATMALKPWSGMILHFKCQHVTPQCIPDLARMSLAKELHVSFSSIFATDLERSEVSLENLRLRDSFNLPN